MINPLSFRPGTAQKFPAITLETPRLVLRPPARHDCAEWIALRRASRNQLIPFEPQWHGQSLTPAFFRHRMRVQAKAWHLGQSCSFLIFQKTGQKTGTENMQLIGGININNICRGAAQYGSPGYWLGTGFQGMGFMQEALHRVIDFAFTAQRLHRLNAATLPHNGRSIKLLRKCGFEEEGFAKAYIQINSEWQDHILFGLPIEKWRAEKPVPAAGLVV